MVMLDSMKIPLQLKSIGVLIVGLLTLDQLTKGMAPAPTFNAGLFFGAFEHSSAFFRVFCVSIAMAVLFLVLTLVQFLYWKLIPKVVWAAALIQSALLGNGLDRLRDGYVRDFIKLPGGLSGFVFNLADLYLWTGIGMILWQLLWRPSQLWPEYDIRHQFLLYPKSQARVIAVLLLVCGSAGFGTFLFAVGYLRAVHVQVSLMEMFIGFLFLQVLMFSVLIGFAVVWSNRIYGPFKSIERYLKEVQPGTRTPVRTRVSDEDECLREILSLIDQKFRT